MEPTKVDQDVEAIIAHTMQVIENFKAKIEAEGNGLLRILARIYGVPVEESEFLGLVKLNNSEVFVLDTRSHALENGKVVPLSQPVNEPSLDETYDLAGQVKLTDTHTDPETGNPLVARGG